VSARRRALCLAMLALTVPPAAFAISELAPSTEGQVPQLSVSTSLQSCGVLDAQLVCALEVSFEQLPNATGYSATVTRADGSVIDMGSVSAGGATLYVPYVGSGTYSVRITAYGEPVASEEPNEDETEETVIATDVAEATAEADDADGRKLETGAATATVRSEAGPREDVAEQPTEQLGETLDAATSCVEPADAADPGELEPLPEEPPEDLDPDDPDEDADEILDEDEWREYEKLLAEHEAAAAAEAAGSTTACPAP